MKPRKLCLQLMLFACFAPALGQTAESLVKKNIKARGGRKALALIHNIKIHQEITQNGGISTSIYYAENHDKFRYDQLQNGNITFSQITNGNKGWMVGATGKASRVGEKDAYYASEADGNPLGPLYKYKERGYQLEYLGKDTLRGSDVHKIKINMNVMEWVVYLDAKTYLEVKIDRSVMNYGRESSYIMWFEDYRQVSGVMFPHVIHSFPQAQKSYDIKRVKIETNVDSEGLFSFEK